jgi:hypothetical protein
MHHKPPGNCNYGGVLIIWDKLFGTYVPEVERIDYFGLAGQPQTFNPLIMNTQHFPKMGWKRLGSKRAHHRWTVDVQALFTPMPPITNGSSSWTLNLSGSKRTKFDGIKQMDYVTLVFFVLAGILSIAFTYAVLITTLLDFWTITQTIALLIVGMGTVVGVSDVSDKGRIGMLLPSILIAAGAAGFMARDDFIKVFEEKIK